MSNGKLEGAIKVPTGGWAMSVDEGGGAQVATVPAGTYYWSSGVTTLPAAIKTALDGTSLTGVFTVGISASEGGTGLASLSSTVAFTLVWTSTDLRDLLGYTATLSPSATSFAGTRHVRNLWLPNCGYQSLNGELEGIEETDYSSMLTASGNSFAWYGESRIVNRITWPLLSRAKTWRSAETTVNASCQQFWRDVVLGRAAWAPRAGGPMRWHPSASVAGTYHEYYAQDWGKAWDPKMVSEEFTEIWEVTTGRLVTTSSGYT